MSFNPLRPCTAFLLEFLICTCSVSPGEEKTGFLNEFQKFTIGIGWGVVVFLFCFKYFKCSLQFFLSGFFINGSQYLSVVHETLGGLVLLSSL